MPKARVNGINLFYMVHGDGEPLVMIHGFAGSSQAWFLQIPPFKKYYKVIVFDSRGIGKSEKAREPYTIRTMADDVIGLMDHLDIDAAHVLGLSLGGIVAQEVAISYPQRVRKLVLASTFAGSEVNDVQPELIEALGIHEGSTRLDISNMDFRKLMNFMGLASFNKRLYRMIIALLSRFPLRSVDPEGCLRQMESVGGYSTLDRLHLITVPTLVIAGTEDRIISPAASELIASRLPDARLVLVEGGSHAFFIEMRTRFNKEVLDFLKKG